MPLTKNDSKKIALKAALAGDSKKASPVLVYDLGGRSSLADFAVLLPVESAPQLDAVEEEVQVRLKAEGVYCLYNDGRRSKNWKVLDYGGVLVHIFDGKAEEFYSINKLYGVHKLVQWEENPPLREGKPPAAKPAAASELKKTEEKPAAKKPAAKKPAAKKPAAKKAAVKRPASKKSAPKKPAAKKKTVKKSAVKKIAAKKTAAKKTSRKK